MSQITLTITANDAADLIEQLRLLQDLYQPVIQLPPPDAEVQAEQEPAQVHPKPPKQTNGRTAAAAPRGRPKVVKVEDEEPKAKPKVIDKAAVRQALTLHIGTHDEGATAALLKKYGNVDRLSDLTEDKYQAVYDAAMS